MDVNAVLIPTEKSHEKGNLISGAASREDGVGEGPRGFQ